MVLFTEQSFIHEYNVQPSLSTVLYTSTSRVLYLSLVPNAGFYGTMYLMLTKKR